MGLGYVGLPLAVALARTYDVTGLDISRARIDALSDGHDATGEIDDHDLSASSLALTSDIDQCRGADIYIVTVPTPVDEANRPDLGPLIAASKTVGSVLESGRKSVIVYESTVYPGVTEEICGPVLEDVSGLRCGEDFFLGYSPERINPGDRQHRLETIVKVVAGQTSAVVDALSELYGNVTTAGVFRAASIRVAEAAKVIENAQRDINIAFMNEITQIFSLMGLSIWDVLDAAKTKWNFLPFHPGLVGGHCIGVDPYYLSYRAQQLGHEPDVILAGRATNDGMGAWIAEQLHEVRGGTAGTVLMLGLTFKENVPDLRNSRVVDVIDRLRQLGHQVTVHDPLADRSEAEHEYGISISDDALAGRYDLVVAAVSHQAYAAMTVAEVRKLLKEGGCVADLKGLWRQVSFGSDVQRWSL